MQNSLLNIDERLIDSLMNPACFPHPVTAIEKLETHISWLLLAGDFVYKIKKPVDFGFLDFSELAKRQFFCHEELRLNRRLAPSLYLDVISIGGSADKPVLGVEPAIEYAVKMRRFAEDALLHHLLLQNKLTVQHLESLAYTLAQFYADLPPAAFNAGYGNAEAVAIPARQNFQQLAQLLNTNYADQLANLQTASELEFGRCLPLFTQRLQAGNVRECHGDLHLGNIVLINDQPIAFDAIEFNPALRWIDVMNDIAFLLMDLQQRKRPDLAYAFLDSYLQVSGDYGGLAVLKFYLGYRAMVMAKVTAIRAAQVGPSANLAQTERYLALAEKFYMARQPALIITFGLPGCGKTTVSQLVLQKYQAIRLRSDVERKRLFGLQALERSNSASVGDIYSKQATQQVYRQLLILARDILQFGFPVIVDAAFLKVQEREQFQNLAEELALPFVILAISVDDNLQRQRLNQRQNDASEADEVVLDKLKSAYQALSTVERKYAVELINNGSVQDVIKQQTVWERLERVLQCSNMD